MTPRHGTRRRSDRPERVRYLDGAPTNPSRPDRPGLPSQDQSTSADHRLLLRLGARDQQAMAALYDRHGPAAFGLALSVCGGDGTAAEGAVEQAFLALWHNPGAFGAGRGSLETQLLAAVHRTASAAARQGGDTPRRDRPGKEGLLRLPAAQREAVALAYFGGLTAPEVAERLGIDVAQARRRIADGMVALRALGRGGRP